MWFKDFLNNNTSIRHLNNIIIIIIGDLNSCLEYMYMDSIDDISSVSECHDCKV